MNSPQANVVFLIRNMQASWHMCEDKFYDFIHYNVQYVLFIVAYIILEW
jgi:hypothetical protein